MAKKIINIWLGFYCGFIVIIKSISLDLLDEFKKDLIGTNILKLKKSCDDNDILDGTQWEIVSLGMEEI